MFLASHLLATNHAHQNPPKPKTCLKMPSWTPQDGATQDSPRWAQDGPKTGRQSTGKSSKILFGALLGPSWGQLGPLRAQLGPSKPRLTPICHASCFLQAPQDHSKTSEQPCCKLSPNFCCPRNRPRYKSTKTPKNQRTNAQAHGVGPAECAERLESAAPVVYPRG